MPWLRVLDFQKVKFKEKEEARKLFEGKPAELLKKEIAEEAARVGLLGESEEEKRQRERVGILQVYLPKS